MPRKLLIVAAILTSAAARADSVSAVPPIAPGKYCMNEPITGSTGAGHGTDLGTFRMLVQVRKKSGRYAISISNQLPDNPQVLDVETDNASVQRDGSLAFRFTDGWDNTGRARVYRNGKVILVMTKNAPMNQIKRNYGTFTVSKSRCSEVKIR